MFKRILAMGLMLGLLSGVAAVSPSQAAPPVKQAAPPVKTLPVAGYTWRDIGPYNDYRFAWAEREKWRDRGHAANILEHKNGFTVRVFDK